MPKIWTDPRADADSSIAAKLVLTYSNTAFTDGVGAQLHRIYGIYAISRLLGVPYLHSPITRVGYQGLAALEANAADPAFHDEFNELFQIRSDLLPATEFHTMNLWRIYPRLFQLLIALVDSGATGGKPGLARVVMPHGIADRFPDCYGVCKEISPFARPAQEAGVFRVAVHARRGEQVVLDSVRVLPNLYYINVARNVARVLDALGLAYQIELWAEIPTREFTVYPDHHGINERISSPVFVTPEMYSLDEFDVLPNLVRCVNGKAIDCMRGLATADVLVMSRSSFSYVAAILNRDGAVMYHPFWHSAPSSWITVAPDGRFDAHKLIQAVSVAKP